MLFLKDTAEVGLDVLMDFLEDPEAEEFVMEWNQEVFEEGKVGLEEENFILIQDTRSWLEVL